MKEHPACSTRTASLRPAIALAVFAAGSLSTFAASAPAPTPPAAPGRSATAPAAATPPASATKAAGRAGNPDLIPQAPPAPGVRIYILEELPERDRPVPTLQGPPTFPPELRRLGISGVVPVEFVVNDKGEVVNVRSVPGSDARFEKAAEDAVSRWRFRPGTVDGKPVSVRITIPVSFRIN